MARSNKKVAAEQVPVAAAPTVQVAGVRAPFQAAGDTISVDGRVIVRHLQGVSLVDSTARAALTVPQTEVFDDIMLGLHLAERPVKRVADFNEFFDWERHFAGLLKGSAEEVQRESTATGLRLTETELATLEGLRALRKRVRSYFEGFLPPYQFAAKSAREAPLRVDEDGEVTNGNHHIKTRQAQNIWNRAYKVWAKGAKDRPREMNVRYSSYRVEVYDDRIQIGCQAISRWQAEQLALAQGWLQPAGDEA